jgi:presenilin-like A22 family membrane protease
VLPASEAWPLRNVVNACIAVTVARALQLPKLGWVCLALGGLVVYDSVSVYGTSALLQSAHAAISAPAPSPSPPPPAAQSVMEAVARRKLSGEEAWQPGLLTIVIDGKVEAPLDDAPPPPPPPLLPLTRLPPQRAR